MQYNIRKFITGLFSVAIMIFLSTNMVQAQDGYSTNTQTQEDDVVDVIQSSDEHTIFASLLQETGMVNELRQEESVTVIAPTDEAFNNMDRDLNELRQNPQELESFVENHVETGNENRANNEDMNRRDTENKRNKDKQDKNKEVMKASNGEVHSVDKVKKDKK